MKQDERLQLLLNRKILIVEDEYFVADETRQLLQSNGAVVVGPAPSVEVGLLLIDSEKIDGAILDIRLQGETVFAIAERLQSLGIPFVFATAYLESNVPEQYGGYLLCEKPTELGAIAAALFSSDQRDH